MNTTKYNKMMQRIMMMAILMTGLFLFGAGKVKAQEDCNSLPAESKERTDCWVKKAKSGEKNLEGADLNGADLTDTDMSNANLIGARFVWATMKGVNLSGADCSRVDFRITPLDGVNFSNSNLSGADFSNSTLIGANFQGATLNKADFSGADLTDADFSGADLTGVKMKPGSVNTDSKGYSWKVAAKTIKGAIVSRSTTKGINFEKWLKQGGKVVD